MSVTERQPLSPLKVAYRADGQWVIAFVSATDGSWRDEIGRISRRVCDERKDLWEQFKTTMREAGFLIIEQVLGAKIVAHEELPPELLEGGGRDV